MLHLLTGILFLFSFQSAQAQRALRNSVNEVTASLSQVNNPALEVCPTTICPAYVLKSIEGDSIASSMPERAAPEEICKSADRVIFKTASDLEQGLRNLDLTTLSKSMPPIESSCLLRITGKNQGQKDKRRSLVVTEYYYLMNRLKMGSALHLDEVAAIDSILGKPVLAGVNCRQFSHFGQLEASCSKLKADQKCKLQNSVSVLAKQTMLALQARRILDQEIRKNPTPEKKANIEAAVKVMRQKYPWMGGAIFRDQCAAFKKCSEDQVARAITAQLSDDRAKHLADAYAIQVPVKCLQGQSALDKSCQDLESTIESMPEFDTALFGESASNKELRTEMDRVICQRYERSRKDTVKKIKKEIGINAGISLLSLGTGTFLRSAFLASRIKNLGTLSKTGLWTAALGVNVAYATPAIKEAKAQCDERLNFAIEEGLSKPHSEVSCPKEMSYGTGNAVYDHHGCMEAVTFAALDMLPFASSYFLKDGKLMAKAGSAATKTGNVALRLLSKAKNGTVEYARQVKATKGLRIIIAPRDNTIKRSFLDKLGQFTFNPIATVRNSKRQFSFPASMITSLIVVDAPTAYLQGKNLKRAQISKDSLPGGNYAWDLMESGAVDPEVIVSILSNHDSNFSNWLDTGDAFNLPRMARLKEALRMNDEEFSAFNKLALAVYKDELAIYKASSATGTKEERALFNENVFKILVSKIDQDAALKKFSPRQKELLSFALFPILPIKGAAKDDFALTEALLLKNTPQMLQIQKLLPMGLSFGEALLMTYEGLNGPSLEKISKAQHLLPPELQALATRPDIPMKEKEVSLLSPGGRSEIKVHDEIDRWKLLLTDQRFIVGRELFGKKEINELEAVKFVDGIIPHFNELYKAIDQMHKQPLSFEETQEVLANPVMGSIAEELEAAAEKHKWTPMVKAQKEKEVVNTWLDYHEKVALEQRPNPAEFQKRFEKLLSK
jgi:hypothetical protein